MKFIFVSCVAVLLFFSCTKKEVDVTAPVIEILDWQPMPGEGEVCGGLDSMVFNMLDSDSLVCLVRISDSSGLSELKVDIHENFDCHGHRDKTRDWLLQQIVPLGGTLFQDKLVILPPANATAGLYHFSVQASDIFGNVTDAGLVFNLQLRNSNDTIMPEWVDILPSQEELTQKRGTPIIFEGVLSDNRPLHLGGNAGVELRYRSLQSGNVFRAVVVNLSDREEAMSSFRLEWTLPLSLPIGKYELQLRGRDGVGNSTSIKKYILDLEP